MTLRPDPYQGVKVCLKQPAGADKLMTSII